MSAAVMPTPLDVGDAYYQNRRNNSKACRAALQQQPQQPSAWRQYLALSSSSRHRNLSGPSATGQRPVTLDNRALATPPPTLPSAQTPSLSHLHHHHHFISRISPESSLSSSSSPSSSLSSVSSTSSSSSSSGHSCGHSHSHRKLDRSMSDTEDRQDRINGNAGARGVNSARYKTELCRPFEESGQCKYGEKCQFAHGMHELRNLSRHPKYKTERCRTYHTIGFCPYGPRCHFIHNDEEAAAAQKAASSSSSSSVSPSSSTSSSPSAGGGSSHVCQRKNSVSSSSVTCNFQHLKQQHQRILPSPSSSFSRPSHLSGLESIGSSLESVSTASSSGHLSPLHLADTTDIFPTISTFSPPSPPHSTSSSLDCLHSCSGSEGEAGSQRTSPVFNFPASDAIGGGSILTPLQVQTQQFNSVDLDLASLQQLSQHFHTLNLNLQPPPPLNANANLNTAAFPPSSTQVPPPSDNKNEIMSSATALSNFNYNLSRMQDVWPVMDTVVRPPPPSASPVSDDSMGSTGSLNETCHLVQSPLDVSRSMRLPIFNQFSAE